MLTNQDISTSVATSPAGGHCRERRRRQGRREEEGRREGEKEKERRRKVPA